jgi:predicted sulfurtransferase
MMKSTLIGIILLGFALAGTSVYKYSAMAKDAPRIVKEDLKAMLDDPDTVILDVRITMDLEGSERKIVGAIREDPMEFESWADKYSKDKTIVLY